MIDHMGITVSNYAKSKLFYDAIFAALSGSMLKQVPMEYTGVSMWWVMAEPIQFSGCMKARRIRAGTMRLTPKIVRRCRLSTMQP